MTQVVNVRVAHIRPKYVDLKEWMSDNQNIYIGRKQIVFVNGTRYPPVDSPFCNPFRLDKNRSEAIAKFRKYFYQKLEDPVFRKQVLELKGKTLGCWCKPEACHGDVIVEWLEKQD